MQTKEYDLIIVGGGVSGLYLAYLAQQKNISLCLIDHQQTLGMKWRIAGGAMGNMTNRTIDSNHYISHTPKEAKKLLQSLFKTFQTDNVISFIHSLGIGIEERDFGQIFCNQPVKYLIDSLIKQLNSVDLYLGEKIHSYHYEENDNTKIYSIQLATQKIIGKKLVIATGSAAYPQVGATDFALRLASKWGHTFSPFSSALSPMLCDNDFPLLGLEGISCNVRMKTQINGTDYKDPCGIRSLLFTHKGISGPAVLVMSCFWQEHAKVFIDFLPEDNLLEKMHDTSNGKKILKNLILPLLPDRLAYKLIPQDLLNKKVAELSKKERQKICDNIHNFCFIPNKLDALKKAEAAKGGISIKEISLNLESILHKNLFFAGECLDITGLLGGYNIHFALACAKRIAERI